MADKKTHMPYIINYESLPRETVREVHDVVMYAYVTRYINYTL